MLRDNRGLRRGFILLEMLYWMTCGTFNTYMVSFLTAERGVSASMAGLLLALMMASACAGQFVIGAICDKHQNNRRVFIGGMALIILLQLGIYFSPSLGMLAVFYMALGFVQQALASVLDTWLIRSFPDDPNAYSPIRALGSLSYAFVMVVMGFSVEKIGHVVMPVYSSLLAVIGIIVAARMPEIPPLIPVKAEAASQKGTLKMLSPAVWLFIISMGIMGMANIPLLNLNLMVLENVGGTVAAMGIATACNTVAEFLVMRYPKPFSRLSAQKQILLAGCLYLGSTLVMVFARNVWLLYAVYFFNGMGYGIILPARRRFVNEEVPPEALNRVHCLGDMSYSNLGGLLGNRVGGLLIDVRGVRLMAAVSLCLQGIGVAMIASLKRMSARKRSA